MIELVWYKSFARAFKKIIKKKPEIEEKFIEALELFVNNPYHPVLGREVDPVFLDTGLGDNQ